MAFYISCFPCRKSSAQFPRENMYYFTAFMKHDFQGFMEGVGHLVHPLLFSFRIMGMVNMKDVSISVYNLEGHIDLTNHTISYHADIVIWITFWIANDLIYLLSKVGPLISSSTRHYYNFWWDSLSKWQFFKSQCGLWIHRITLDRLLESNTHHLRYVPIFFYAWSNNGGSSFFGSGIAPLPFTYPGKMLSIALPMFRASAHS